MIQALSDIKKNMKKRTLLYIMILPVVLYYIIFHYWPMYGAIIAFKDYSPGKGILGSPWVGLLHFKNFFESFYFFRILRNTLLINYFDILLGFPVPIIFALLLNELSSEKFKKTVQTITYFPHFISTIVLCGMIINFTSLNGIINHIVAFFGGTKTPFLLHPEWFRTVFVGSGIWQGFGWGSIIYLATLTGIDPTLYEAASIDGAGRFKKILHITIPGIMPTVMIMLILRIGNAMNVGAEKVILLYNPNTYETSDVISSFVYRRAFASQTSDFSFSTAVGLFNSVINFILLIGANKLSRKTQGSSLW